MRDIPYYARAKKGWKFVDGLEKIGIINQDTYGTDTYGTSFHRYIGYKFTWKKTNTNLVEEN